MARRLRPCFSATDVTALRMDQAPSTDQREVRRVNPLLYAVAAQMSHLPRTANGTVSGFMPLPVTAFAIEQDSRFFSPVLLCR